MAAAKSPPGASADAAFSPERLARIDRLLQQYVDQNRVAGAVALVLHDDKPVYERAVGWSDMEAGRKMTTSTVFRIASQTKAITSTAVLALVEEGKIGLNEPVGHFIPTFSKTTVAVKSDSGTTTVAARRAITIQDLLTHTAGISYGTDSQVAALYEAKGLGPAAGNGWYTADKDEPICETMERQGILPLVAQPGEAFVYGYNTDILGCVVEKASGMTLDEFVRTRITRPLGMKDTRFYLPPAERDRLAAVYSSGRDGLIVRAPQGSKGQGSYVDGPRKSFGGGAGLTSTARDYAHFLGMIRKGGALGGVRILAPRTVDLMTTNQSGMAIQRVDKPLQSFSMTTADGPVVTLGDLQGQVVVLSFWATWCGPCVAEYPRISDLRGRYTGDPRVVFWAVNPGLGDGTIEAMRTFVKNRGWDIPTAFDQGQVARSIGISSVPSIAILDRAGHVRVIHSGYDGGEDLAGNLSKEIRALLE
jgi:CubicO group peptidase (beta-lactamase class C family)